MNQPDESDDLWRLLGKARPPEVSPFFARNVVREVRGLRQETPGLLGMLLRHYKLALVSGATALVAAVAVWQFDPKGVREEQIDSLVALTEQVTASPDFEVIDNLDVLLASEESSVWLETTQL